MTNRRGRRIVVHLTDLLGDQGATGLRTPEQFAGWFTRYIEGIRDFQVEYIRVEDTPEPSVYEEGGERVGG